MDWLKDLMRAEGLKPQDTPNSGLRSKLLTQVEKQLTELNKYKTEAELDGNGSKYWWSAQSVEGQRRLVMRLNGKTISGSSTYVDNTLTAVKDGLNSFKRVLENTKDEQWADEEERLKKKS